jgi:hypothetical protein
LTKLFQRFLEIDQTETITAYGYSVSEVNIFLPMEKSLTFTGGRVNEIISSINRPFVYKAKEGRHVKICVMTMVFIKAFE